MKTWHCEMCGGTESVKSGDLFVCQSCGAKYTVEEARKMLSDEPAPAEPVQPAPAVNAPQPVYEEARPGYAGLILSIFAFIIAIFCAIIWLTLLWAIFAATPSSSAAVVFGVASVEIVLILSIVGIGLSIPGWILSAKNKTTPFFAAFSLFTLVLIPLTVFLCTYLSALFR